MKNLLISLLFLLPLSANSQCQEYVFSTVPATEWSTWTYINCVTLDTVTLNIPCCGYTAPRCAILGSPTLVAGDGFFAALTSPLGEPWEDCEQYNEEPCVGDINEDGIITVQDLLIYLSEPNVGMGDLVGFLSNFGNQCD
jgi:hypothetical protein